MFKHSGKKLQSIAIAVFVMALIIGGLIAIVIPYMIYVESYGYAQSDSLVIAGCIIFAIFAFFAWVSALILYAFGKITESQETFLRALQNGALTNAKTPVAVEPQPQYVMGPEQKQQLEQWKNKVAPDTKCVCPKCKTENSADAVYCRKCGAPLKME